MWVRVTALTTSAAMAALVVLACAPQPAGAPPAALAPGLDTPARPPRVVFLGSSTTAGSGASAPSRRWSSIVSRRLGWVEVNRGLSNSLLTNLGRQVPSGEERWRAALARAEADAVLLMYGANDVLAHVPLGDPETPGTFRHAAAAMLRGIREALPEAAIVVCSPQPSEAMAARRKPYDAALAEAAATAGALFVPAGEAFPEHRFAAYAADRLHLNDAGHAAVAEFVLAELAASEARGLVVPRPRPLSPDRALPPDRE
jgi:lysophospholipase L1-like esterase